MLIYDVYDNPEMTRVVSGMSVAHGVRVDNSDATIIIPIKQGRDSIIVQGSSEEQERETSAVFAVNVAQVDDDENKNEEARQMETKVVVPRPYQEDLEDNKEMAEGLQDLLEEYAHCFVEVSGLGCVKIGVEHEIPVRCMVPIRSRPYRLTWEEEKYLQEELTRLLDLGLISSSNGQWTSPIFFVKKKDGQLRLVVDYRKLNDRTIKDAYSLPQIDNLLDSMGGACVFSTLDAASGYWQIPLSKEASERSGFVCPFGTFTWNVMSFGLTSAPSTFQRTMHTILQRFIGKFVYCFIDDIIIYSRSMSEHQEHLRLVFEACDKANLRLKYSKCSFGQKSVEYLGHVVSDQGLSPTARNVSKILEMPPPRNVEEVQDFRDESHPNDKKLKVDDLLSTVKDSFFMLKHCLFKWVHMMVRG
ncbi:retroelement pol polyprotein [Lichtheimia corymbifera JMRC:FSU:9682]|uniref:Retroelement pol polyprotein n=1 Tax=Lichtheimia corymbifera JMRC:FSU:9682 TaxID=1263082 RepID=A0A068SGS6_9FUNG|nr:retroelement pol polyprotein [Lichtheimia corymbifera JMRC:FSU:9682]